MLLATNGRFYSLDVAKLPGGRGHGEPIRMFIDMEQDAAIVSLFVNSGGRKFLIASHEGQGFIVNDWQDEFPALRDRLVALLEKGRLAWQEDVQKGFEQAPAALMRLFVGANRGKQLLEL